MSEDIKAEIASAREATGDIMQAARFAVSQLGVLRCEDREIAFASELIAQATRVAELEAEAALSRAGRTVP